MARLVWSLALTARFLGQAALKGLRWEPPEDHRSSTGRNGLPSWANRKLLCYYRYLSSIGGGN